MSITRRLDKLEVGRKRTGDDCACAPFEASEIRVHRAGEPRDDSPTRRCEVCGGAKRLIILQLVYTREELQEAEA
jgi:hypothetical protein